MATPELVQERAAAPPVAVTFDLVPAWHGIFGEPGTGWLNRYCVEREDPVSIQGLCAICGVDFMLVGPPGAGKTHQIELMVDHCIVDATIFTHLLAKDQSADEVLGPKSLNALKEDRIRRMTAGMLPEANFGYLDEFFKASAPMLNPMLDVMATRKLKVGGEVKRLDRLVSIAMSSNELPTGREDLSAVRDRVDVTLEIGNVASPAGWRKVFQVQREIRMHGLDTAGLRPLTLDEIFAIRREVMAIEIPDTIGEVMVELLGEFQERDHLPSMRRFERMQRMAMAHAWTNERKEVNVDDLVVMQHMAWNDLDHAPGARQIVNAKVGTFANEAMKLREEMESVTAGISRVQATTKEATTRQAKEAATKEGTEFFRQLRTVREKAEETLESARRLGKPTADVERVIGEIEKAKEWAYKALSGLL